MASYIPELLIHSDSTDGAIDIIDSSPNEHTIVLDLCTHSITEKKWGATGIAMVDVQSGLTVTVPPVRTLPPDLSVDFWFLPVTSILADCFKMTFDCAGDAYEVKVWRNFANIILTLWKNTVLISQVSGAIGTGTFIHFGLSFSSSTGLTMYKDVVLFGTLTDSVFPDVLENVVFTFGEPDAAVNPDCYFDEIRIVSGSAIDFAAEGLPTGPYKAINIVTVEGVQPQQYGETIFLIGLLPEIEGIQPIQYGEINTGYSLEGIQPQQYGEATTGFILEGIQPIQYGEITTKIKTLASIEGIQPKQYGELYTTVPTICMSDGRQPQQYGEISLIAGFIISLEGIQPQQYGDISLLKMFADLEGVQPLQYGAIVSTGLANTYDALQYVHGAVR